MAKVKLTVEVTYKKVSGARVDPDELHEAIEQGIEQGVYDAEISGLDDNGTSEYEVTNVSISAWDVGEA